LAAGSGPIKVFESPLTFRLVYVSGEINFVADYLQFTSETSTESRSWGVIKSLFR